MCREKTMSWITIPGKRGVKLPLILVFLLIYWTLGEIQYQFNERVVYGRSSRLLARIPTNDPINTGDRPSTILIVSGPGERMCLRRKSHVA